MSLEKKSIKIIASNGTEWYKNLIGEIYEVEDYRYRDGTYEVVIPNWNRANGGFLIHENHFEFLELNA